VKASVHIKLGTITSRNGSLKRPTLLLNMDDWRNNVAIQEVPKKTQGLGASQIEQAVVDKLDKSIVYDLVTPYPVLQYEYDRENEHTPSFAVTFYLVKGGMSNFVSIIMPMVLIATMNAVNVWFDYKKPLDIENYLSSSATFALTAVVMLPTLVPKTARHHLWSMNNFYIVVVFVSLALSSIPNNFSGTKVVNMTGMFMLGASFVIPVFNCFLYNFEVQHIRRIANRLVPHSNQEGPHPFLKDDDYNNVDPEPAIDDIYITVDSIATSQQDTNEANAQNHGELYQKKPGEGRFCFVEYV